MDDIVQMYGQAAIGGLVLFAGLAVWVFIKGKIEQAARAREMYQEKIVPAHFSEETIAEAKRITEEGRAARLAKYQARDAERLGRLTKH